MAIKRAPTSGRGVAHGLAVAIGISPELAVPAGERAVAAMMALKQAREAGGGALRGQHLHRAQQHIAALDPARHGTLARHLQAHALALQGRGGDTRIAHVTPGEVVVPKRLQNPEFLTALQFLARAHGIDPATLRVGSGRNVINPRTGQMEFDDDSDDEGDIYGDGGKDIDPGFDAPGFDGLDVDPGFDGTGENILENPPANSGDKTDNPFTPLYTDGDGKPIEGITVAAHDSPSYLGSLGRAFVQGAASDFGDSPYGQNAKTGIFKGIDHTIGWLGDREHEGLGSHYLPTSDDIDRLVFSITPEYVPTTMLGRIGQGALNFGTQSVLGGAVDRTVGAPVMKGILGAWKGARGLLKDPFE